MVFPGQLCNSATVSLQSFASASGVQQQQHAAVARQTPWAWQRRQQFFNAKCIRGATDNDRNFTFAQLDRACPGHPFLIPRPSWPGLPRPSFSPHQKRMRGTSPRMMNIRSGSPRPTPRRRPTCPRCRSGGASHRGSGGRGRACRRHWRGCFPRSAGRPRCTAAR